MTHKYIGFLYLKVKKRTLHRTHVIPIMNPQEEIIKTIKIEPFIVSNGCFLWDDGNLLCFDNEFTILIDGNEQSNNILLYNDGSEIYFNDGEQINS